MDPDFKLLFFGGSRSSSPLALVLEIEGPIGLLKNKVISDICNENDSSKTTRNNNNMFASGYFSHSHFVSLRALISNPGI